MTPHRFVRSLQPLRRLRFIEGPPAAATDPTRSGCSLSGGCASLREEGPADARAEPACCSLSGGCASLRGCRSGQDRGTGGVAASPEAALH